MKQLLWLGVALGVVALPIRAAVIFDNGAPDQVSGDNMSEFLMAEDFTLGAAYDVTNIRFWSIQASAADYRGSVYWAIHANTANAPGALLFGGTTAAITGVATGNTTGFAYVEYLFDNPVAFQLAPGTYWLALHNGPISNGSAAEMLWATTATGSGLAGRYTTIPVGANPSWFSTDQEHAFLLEGDRVIVDPGIPEPSSMLLLSSGGIALALLRRKLR